jgi:hypothetical protein
MVKDMNSTVTFVITPSQGASLYQLQVSKHTPIKTKVTTINPLELLGVEKLERSTYYSVGFFPLNSILEVTVLSNDNIGVVNHGGDLVDTTFKNGQKIPTDLTKAGWIMDPESGQKISAVYLFGTTTSISKEQSSLTLGAGSEIQPSQNNTTSGMPTPMPSSDYSLYVSLVGIVAAGGVAIYLFMRRR